MTGNGYRKRSRMQRGVSTGLVFVLLLLILAPVGRAQSQAAAQTQGDVSAVWRLPFLRTDHTTIFQHLSNQVQRIIVFGGWNGRQFFNDVWALDMADPDYAAWSKLNPHSAWPPSRAQHTAIYDAANQRMIVFGGHSSHYNFDDVWALDLSIPGSETWTQLTPGGVPIGARRYHSAVYDAANERMVVFGGSGRGGLRNDVWALDLSTPGAETWSQLSVTGSVPAARWQHTAIYDSVNGLMVVFGGSDGSALRNDIWALNLATLHWAELSPAGDPPPPRRKHSAAFYDEANNMLLFGGLGSGGFLNDLWCLRLPPNTLEWIHIDPTNGPPAARAGHTAILSYVEHPMIVLGGRGMGSLTGETQWLYDPSTVSWSQFTPDLPNWWQGGGMAAQSALGPQSSGRPDVTLQIEDAAPDTTVNVMPNQEVWFVTKIKTSSLTYVHNISVTLDVAASKLEVVGVGLRYKPTDAVTWRTFNDLGGGRYNFSSVDLEKRGNDSKYQMQVVFKANVKATARQGWTHINVVAEGDNWQNVLDYNAQAIIRPRPQAWIVVNRNGLFDAYKNSAVRSLLDKVFEVAQGGAAYNNSPAAVVLYADRHVPALQTWDNTDVNYTNKTTANTAADALDAWLDGWATYPDYLVLLGDDNTLPFYRKPDPSLQCLEDGEWVDCGEAAHPDCFGEEPVCDDLVSNGFYMTDNPYGDIAGGTDWKNGDLEIAVGRIVGIDAADMQKFWESSVAGPSSQVTKAVLASDGLDLWLPGVNNDAHDVLKNDLGYSMNESLIDQEPTKTEIVDQMADGFNVMVAAHHGETYLWETPGGSGPDWDTGALVSNELPLYDPAGRISTDRPFFQFNACRMGLGYTSGWGAPDYYDDSMVYALVHRGASGIIASAGLGYGCFDANVACGGETLVNDFWVTARAYPDRSNPLGWTLRVAKENFRPTDAFGRKTVQTFTYFGVPWMRLPGHGSTAASAVLLPDEGAAFAPAQHPGVQPAALSATFVTTASVDTTSYTTTTTSEGYDLIEVTGLFPHAVNGAPVLPEATLELFLPLSATVSSLVFTPTQAITLPAMNIPTLGVGVPIPGGPGGGYTDTVDGVYPLTVTVDTSALDLYQRVQVHVVPVTYDATGDQATLYRQVDIAVQYDTPETLAVTHFEPDKVQYVPGETISTTARLINAGITTQTVTATLLLQDTEGRIVGLKGLGAVDIPAGGSADLGLGWTGVLDGGVYVARLFIWQGGQVVAGAGSRVLVTAGEITGVSVPDTLMLGATGTFSVTIKNLTSSANIALASLSVYDDESTLVAFLPAKAVTVAGESSATLSFQWTADGSGPHTASFMLAAGGQEYGPLSQDFDVGYHIYLPLILRND